VDPRHRAFVRGLCHRIDDPTYEEIAGGDDLATVAYNIRFAGQVFDGQAGLHQNGYRDYDPAIGRCAEYDPAGLEAGINTYSYVNQLPLWRIDPLGLSALSYPEIANVVARNNHSGLSDELIICLLWNESNFDPNAGHGRQNIGTDWEG
jgi:RHS repeat-associated protein